MDGIDIEYMNYSLKSGTFWVDKETWLKSALQSAREEIAGYEKLLSSQSDCTAKALNERDTFKADADQMREAIRDRKSDILATLNGIDKTELDAPEGWWETSTGAEFGANCLQQIIAIIDSLLTPPAAPEKAECRWTWDDDGFWKTACGSSWFYDSGTPKENGQLYCHHCGKPIAEGGER